MCPAGTIHGEMQEWLNWHAWNACMAATSSRVRIPLSPPYFCHLSKLCHNRFMKQYGVAVLGGSGFAGQELTGILENHPAVASVQTPVTGELAEFEGSEVVFAALPNHTSAREVDRHYSNGSTVIDLSGDLRFPTAGSYNAWHDRPHPAPHLLPAPYCLPEYPHIAGKHTPDDPRHTSLAEGRKLASMPGCYPTATLLGLLPLLHRGLIDMQGAPIIIDADSGISGRGKKPSEETHFMSVSNNAVSYKTGRQHRHVGEMELFLDGNEVFFSPTTIAIERGMLVKATARLAVGTTLGQVRQAFVDAYEATPLTAPFVKVLPEDELPTIQETVRTDECHIGFVVVNRTIQIGSSLDNLRKGAASQAVQAFNVMHGLDETVGLTPKKG